MAGTIIGAGSESLICMPVSAPWRTGKVEQPVISRVVVFLGILLAMNVSACGVCGLCERCLGVGALADDGRSASMGFKQMFL